MCSVRNLLLMSRLVATFWWCTVPLEVAFVDLKSSYIISNCFCVSPLSLRLVGGAERVCGMSPCPGTGPVVADGRRTKEDAGRRTMSLNSRVQLNAPRWREF